jgi:predicted aldo/keto reductase-like oxidoreductase
VIAQLIRPLRGIVMPTISGRENFNNPHLSPELYYRFVLSNPNVHVVLTGLQNRQQPRQNLDTIKQDPLEPDEISWIRHYGKWVKTKKRLDYVK